MSTPGFLQCYTKLAAGQSTYFDGAAMNNTDFGNVYGGAVSGTQLSKFFLLKSVAISCTIIDLSDSSTFFTGSGTLTFNDLTGFAPYQRYALPGLGNGGWSILNGLNGTFAGNNGGTLNFSVSPGYNGPGNYVLLNAISIQKSSVPVVFCNLPLSYQPGYSVVGTQGGFLGQTVRVLSNGAFPFSWTLTVDDTITGAYYLPSDFGPLPGSLS